MLHCWDNECVASAVLKGQRPASHERLTWEWSERGLGVRLVAWGPQPNPWAEGRPCG